jgi:hypothetical protein
VFLAALLKRNPVGIESAPAGVDKQGMAVLQAAVWQQFNAAKVKNNTGT